MYQDSCSVQLTAAAAKESAIVLTSSGMSPEPPKSPEGLSRFLHSPENTAIEIARPKYTTATIILKSKSYKQIYTLY